MTHQDIIDLLGSDAASLLNHTATKISQTEIHHPSPKHVTEIFKHSDRSRQVKKNLAKLYRHGRLGGSGYLSIFPVDQGIEHSAGYSFANNPIYFDPENIVKLAYEAETSGVVSTLGALGLVSKKYASKIPFIVKLNHKEQLTYPLTYDQTMFAQVKQAASMGAIGVGATIYFGSPESRRQIVEVSQAFAQAHESGLFTMLWCYPRNDNYQTKNTNFESAVDITGQANYLGVSLEADIIKQKMPTAAFAFKELNIAKHQPEMYENLIGTHPIDLVRYQVANCFMGKISLLNSGGSSSGENDIKEIIKTAVINKRGGGAGLVAGRKVFNRSFKKGLALIRAIQDVYLDTEITLA